MILIDVNGANVIVRKQDTLTSGMVGAAVVFRFDEDWNSLAKTAVFRSGKVIKDAIIVDSVAEIPHEVLATYGYALEIGVYGTADDGAVVIPTIWAKTDPIKPGTDPSGDESLDPSLPVWAQMQEQLNSMYLSASVRGTGWLTAEQIAALDGMFKIAAYTADATTAYAGFKTAFGITDSGNPVDGNSEEETNSHSYASTVTKIATCETAGVRTFTCSCGNSYTEEIPATGHKYSNGVCSICGKKDLDEINLYEVTGENGQYLIGNPTNIVWGANSIVLGLPNRR